MSLPIEMRASISAAMVGKDLTPPEPAPEAMARLQRLHETAGHLTEDAPSVLTHPEAARGLEQALIEAMMHCLGEGEIYEDRAALRQHAAIMRRFHRVIEEHLDDPLYIPELCREIGTSLRTLHASCQGHLGMGAKRYLLLRRMNMVRRALAENPAHQTTVTEVATRYGFWQFGRAYKALFGEAPWQHSLGRPEGPTRQPADMDLVPDVQQLAQATSQATAAAFVFPAVAGFVRSCSDG